MAGAVTFSKAVANLVQRKSQGKKYLYLTLLLPSDLLLVDSSRELIDKVYSG